VLRRIEGLTTRLQNRFYLRIATVSYRRIHASDEKDGHALAFALRVALPAISNAATIVDVVNPEPDVRITTSNSPYSYVHNLLDNGYVVGRPITSATIDILLTDDIELLQEKVSFYFDNILSGTASNVPSWLFGSENYHFNLTTSLLTDGLLNVSLSVGCNGSIFGACILPQDVIFQKSTLTANVVPEPATLGILGLGLLGMAGMRRWRK
jgi:hypothetical protein